MSRTKSVLWWATGWITGIFVIMLIMAGLFLVSNPAGAAPGSVWQRAIGNLPQAVTIAIGCILLAVGVVVIMTTMTLKDGTASRWVKALPGVLGVATFNALNSLINGHVTNLPSKTISRADALVMTLLFLGSTIGSAVAFRGRSLNWVDRAALVAFVISVGWSMLVDSATGLAVGLCCLLFAWAFDRVKRRGQNSRFRSQLHVKAH